MRSIMKCITVTRLYYDVGAKISDYVLGWNDRGAYAAHLTPVTVTSVISRSTEVPVNTGGIT